MCNCGHGQPMAMATFFTRLECIQSTGILDDNPHIVVNTAAFDIKGSVQDCEGGDDLLKPLLGSTSRIQTLMIKSLESAHPLSADAGGIRGSSDVCRSGTYSEEQQF